MSNAENGKIFIVGLDGVPYTLLMDYIAKGYLPGFKRILDDGYRLNQRVLRPDRCRHQGLRNGPRPLLREP